MKLPMSHDFGDAEGHSGSENVTPAKLAPIEADYVALWQAAVALLRETCCSVDMSSSTDGEA
jgi:hypothetical protein